MIVLRIKECRFKEIISHDAIKNAPKKGGIFLYKGM